MKIRSSILTMLTIAAVATGCSSATLSGPGEPGSPAEETDVVASELGAGPGGGMFAQADVDKDGRVTLAEAQASALSRFTVADANKDGQIDETEMQAMHGNRGGPAMLKHLDKNADGKLSKEEAPERMRGHFDTVDSNKDGLIDEAEMEAAHGHRGGPGGPGMLKHLDKNADGKLSKEEAPERMREHFESDRCERGRAARGGGAAGDASEARWSRDRPEAQQPGGKRGGMMMKQLDANNDGKLSQAEFTSKIAQWFARADANGDGAITPNEFLAKRPRGPRGGR